MEQPRNRRAGASSSRERRTGGAVTVAAAGRHGRAGTDGPTTAPALDATTRSRGYRMTDHIERYYRLARS